MPRDTLLALIGTGDHLLATVQANSADLAHLEETRLQLATSMDVARAVSVRHDTAKALVQQATRDLEKSMADTQELVTRLRNDRCAGGGRGPRAWHPILAQRAGT